MARAIVYAFVFGCTLGFMLYLAMQATPLDCTVSSGAAIALASAMIGGSVCFVAAALFASGARQCDQCEDDM